MPPRAPRIIKIYRIAAQARLPVPGGCCQHRSKPEPVLAPLSIISNWEHLKLRSGPETRMVLAHLASRGPEKPVATAN